MIHSLLLGAVNVGQSRPAEGRDSPWRHLDTCPTLVAPGNKRHLAGLQGQEKALGRASALAEERKWVEALAQIEEAKGIYPAEEHRVYALAIAFAIAWGRAC